MLAAFPLIAAMALTEASVTVDPATFEALVARVEALDRRVEALQTENAQLRAEIRGSAYAAAPAGPAPPPVESTQASQAVSYGATPQRRWDHIYLGAQLAFRHQPSRSRISTAFTTTVLDDDGYYAGGQIGRRWQSGNIVGGFEMEVLAGLDDDRVTNTVSSLGPPSSSRSRTQIAVAAKGELGIAFGRTLAYALAGGEMTRRRIVGERAGEVTVDLNTETAPFLGAGLAHQLLPNLSVELEGRIGFSHWIQQFRGDRGLSLRVNYLIP